MHLLRFKALRYLTEHQGKVHRTTFDKDWGLAAELVLENLNAHFWITIQNEEIVLTELGKGVENLRTKYNV